MKESSIPHAITHTQTQTRARAEASLENMLQKFILLIYLSNPIDDFYQLHLKCQEPSCLLNKVSFLLRQRPFFRRQAVFIYLFMFEFFFNPPAIAVPEAFTPLLKMA